MFLIIKSHGCLYWEFPRYLSHHFASLYYLCQANFLKPISLHRFRCTCSHWWTCPLEHISNQTPDFLPTESYVWLYTSINNIVLVIFQYICYKQHAKYLITEIVLKEEQWDIFHTGIRFYMAVTVEICFPKKYLCCPYAQESLKNLYTWL